ncbi:hypothetical protein [Luteolibacter sp. AS25]|uniref:hypothetical protein n=1 Tax=Luteolibacter sp. AS25 TaxID=3135776 RepID=UPI00398A5F3F
MKSILRNRSCAAVLGLFLALGATSGAHPGPPGHAHFPDEVDEFDQVTITSPAKSDVGQFDLGGLMVLMLVGGCLIYAFSQKQGGIWRDSTSEH